MRVLVIADPLIPVPPAGYGGTERVVHDLAAGLASRGHHVCLMAGPGSCDPGRLIVHEPSNGRGKLFRGWRKASFWVRSWVISSDVDVMVNFGRLDYALALLRLSDRPFVARFGNPVSEGEVSWVLRQRRRNLRLVSISDAQRRHVSHFGRWETIYNGIDTGRFGYMENPRERPYLIFLGLVAEYKGVHIAIEVARRVGMRLLLAGPVPERAPGAREFFESRIRPRLGGAIEWIGEVNDEQKVALLGGARALLFPIQWEEPFGIVMAEALSCGTPVIGFNRGSVPEVVSHGRTGYVVDTPEEMIEAIRKIDRIDRAVCRAEAVQRFSREVMVDRYVALFEEMLAGR
jgi:glycosyltransferase involved in cell wall biosynthesis